MSVQPMLGKEADLSKLSFPLMASAKLDGFRCMADQGVALSRKWKPFVNKFIQEHFRLIGPAIQGYDGEIIVGDPFGTDVLARTSSGVTSVEGEPDFTFHVFDRWDMEDRFIKRFDSILPFGERVRKHPHTMLFCMTDLETFEQTVLDLGYEGVILRGTHAPYKHGRSTVKEGGMLKIKRFEDAEAIIVGYKEKMHNGNEATLDAFGHTKRSSHQAGKTGLDTLGAWVCRGVNGRWAGVQFDVGGAMTDAQRSKFWAEREAMIGKTITYKWFTVGCKDAPRHPNFKCIKDDIEL